MNPRCGPDPVRTVWTACFCLTRAWGAAGWRPVGPHPTFCRLGQVTGQPGLKAGRVTSSRTGRDRTGSTKLWSSAVTLASQGRWPTSPSSSWNCHVHSHPPGWERRGGQQTGLCKDKGRAASFPRGQQSRATSWGQVGTELRAGVLKAPSGAMPGPGDMFFGASGCRRSGSGGARP